MGKKRCKCGSSRFEQVDVTPVGCSEEQYFIRCSKCGLVVFSCTHLPVKSSSYFQKVLNKCSFLTTIIGKKA